MYTTYLLVMCRSQYPPNFLGKKNGKDQNSVSCTKRNILFLVSTRNNNISRGCATKTEFPEGRGVHFVSRFLEDPERSGGHRKNPFCWGGGRYEYFLELHIEYKAPSRETRIFTEIKRDTVYFNIVIQKLWNKLSLNWYKNNFNWYNFKCTGAKWKHFDMQTDTHTSFTL